MAIAANLLLVWLSTAPSKAPVHVAVDWSAVSDRTVERCGLSGLQAMLLQTLLEDGFAVVEGAAAAQMTLTIKERRRRLIVEVTGGGVVRREAVRIIGACDATIQFLLQRAALSVLRQVQEVWPPAVHADGENQEPAKVAPVPAAPTWSFSPQLHAGAVTHHPLHPFAALAVGLRIWRDGSASFGLTGELAYRPEGQLNLVEPALVVCLSRRLWHTGQLNWHVGVGLALAGHILAVDEELSGHVDIQGRAPLRIHWEGTGVFLELTAHVRGRPVVHRLNGIEVFRAQRLGGSLSLGYLFNVPTGQGQETPYAPRASID